MKKLLDDKALKCKAIKALNRIPITAQRVLDRIEAREAAELVSCPKCHKGFSLHDRQILADCPNCERLVWIVRDKDKVWGE